MTSYQFVVLEQQHADMDKAMNMKNLQHMGFSGRNIFHDARKMIAVCKDRYWTKQNSFRSYDRSFIFSVEGLATPLGKVFYGITF